MATRTQSAEAPAAQAQNGLPLFFRSPMPLDLLRHGKAGVMPTQQFSFAADTNSVVVNAVEFFEAAKHYPIVFTQAEPMVPMVVVGLEKHNIFINKKGEWKEEAYIPAYVRKYPFVFMDAAERKQFVLCIDESAPQYKVNGGKNTSPLYEDNKPSDVTRNALEFCTAFHNHYQLTRRFCEDLKAAGVLTPTRSDVKLASGREIQLGGFQVIDEKKMSELPDATVLEFYKNGWLPLIYAALMSTSNWKKLVDMTGK